MLAASKILRPSAMTRHSLLLLLLVLLVPGSTFAAPVTYNIKWKCVACYDVVNESDASHNMRDMVARGRSAAGERNGSARLTESDVRDIRQLAVERSLRYGDVSVIARRYGVSPRTIKLILTGETWKIVESTDSRCDNLDFDRLSPARRAA
jgi:hypothetical protein